MLPQRALMVLEHVGRSGPTGVLQAELANLCSMSAVKVSHYTRLLGERRLVARRKVVLTTRKEEGANVTFTAVIVLARFARMLDQSHGGKRTTGEVEGPAQLGDGNYPSHPQIGDVNGLTIHSLNVEMGAKRILDALKTNGVMAQRDLKVIALPDEDKPPAFSDLLFTRRRHRMFRAFRMRLIKAGLVEAVDRECVDKVGKVKGILKCLKLTGEMEEKGKVVVKEEGKAGGIVAEEDDDDAEGEGAKVISPGEVSEENEESAEGWKCSNGSVSLNRGKEWRKKVGSFVAEVDLLEQVYRLLRKAGPKGMSVPELYDHLDGGCDLTSAAAKRIRNIVTGISRFAPIVETQCFEGSIMVLRIVLAEFSDMNGVMQTQKKTAVAKLTQLGVESVSVRNHRKSELARKKDEMTTLGLQRQEMVMKLLEEKKAIITETLGRQVAELEGTGLHRVDQKVMKRVINSLVLQKRANILTTIKPTVTETKQLQTIRMVVLPGLTHQSPEVVNAISSVVANVLYGRAKSAQKTSQKRKAEQMVPNLAEAELDDSGGTIKFNARVELKVSGNRPTKRGRLKPNETPAGKNSSRDASSHGPVGTLPHGGKDVEESHVQATGESNHLSDKAGGKKPSLMNSKMACKEPPFNGQLTKKDAVLVNAKRDTKASRISRLVAIDHGWMKGKMTRAKTLHEQLYKISILTLPTTSVVSNSMAVQHSTIERAKSTPKIGSFTISSCLQEMTVSTYAAVVGIYNDYGEQIEAVYDKKVREVPEIMDAELKCKCAERQICSLVQVLIKLNLLVSGEETKFSLSGAGVLRDFGRGVPPGLFPHGIIFSSQDAVNVYWRELSQYAQFPHFGILDGNNGDTLPKEEQFVDKWSYPVPDVYARASWNKSLTHTFMLSEQLNLEGTLQSMSGVLVFRDSMGQYLTSNFITTTLKRFSVSEIVDEAIKAAANSKKPGKIERSYLALERLLVYSRYRAQHPLPPALCEETNVRNSTNVEAAAPSTSRSRVRTVLRLVRGKCNVQPTIEICSLPRDLVSPLKENTLSKNRHKLITEQPATSETPRRVRVEVDLDRCVSLLRIVVHTRALQHCENSGVVPDWNVTSLFTDDDKTSDKGLSSQRRTIRKRLPKNPRRDKKNPENSVYQKIATDLCSHASMQAILECLSLKLALRLSVARQGAPVQSIVDLCPKLQAGWESLNSVLVAAVLQTEYDLYRRYRVAFKTTDQSDLHFCEKHEQAIEAEFNLKTNTRMSVDQTWTQRMQLLAERYRLLVELTVSESLQHGFIFREDSMEEIMCPSDEDPAPIRAEVMERILMSILNEGRRAQKSNKIVLLLRGFRLQDIVEARNRLLLREAFTVCRDVDGSRYFQTCTKDRGEAKPMSLKRVRECEDRWTGKLEQETSAGVERFRRTTLGQQTLRRSNGSESIIAAMTSVRLMFCAKARRLEMKPVIGKTGDGGLGIGMDLGAMEEWDKREDEHRRDGFTMLDVEFKYQGKNADSYRGEIRKEVREHVNLNELDGASDIGNELEKELETLVHSRGYVGITLEELEQVKVGQAHCDDERLCEAVEHVLQAGVIRRIVIEGGDVKWYSGRNVLFVAERDSKSVEGKSVWTDTSGNVVGILDEVASGIVNIVSRKPGIEVGEIIKCIQMRFGGICQRDVGDVVYELGRCGVVRVEQVLGDGGGVFGRNTMGVGGGWIERGIDRVGDGEWYVSCRGDGLNKWRTEGIEMMRIRH